ncbi:diacetylchitobiose ABC transporter ATP-binding protein MsiK [Nocardiopsis tropica]
MATVTFESTSRFYTGVERPAVDRLDLEIEDGEFMVLVGPSGCGKTTTLRMLAGLEGVDEGRILIGDRDVTDIAPAKRDISMVFQNYALYPHMSVAQNIGFHLKIAGMVKSEISDRVAAAARTLDLTQYLDRKPAKLSGGQRQRVAMGRAIVRSPQVSLMDEPLSNLDAKLRVQTRGQIARLQAELGITTLYVTHDQVEAMTMGHRVAVLKNGVLQQVDTPAELFAKPRNIFVAGFIGSPAMNLLLGTKADGGVNIGGLIVPVARDTLASIDGDAVVLGVRPEGFVVGAAGAPGIAAKVDVVEELGSDSYGYARAEVSTVDPETGAASDVPVVVRGGSGLERGAEVTLTVVPDHVHVFDPNTGERCR